MAIAIKRTHIVARRIAGGLGLFTAALGVIGLMGWLLDEPLLRTVVSGYASMKVNTALGLMAAGFSMVAFTLLPIENRYCRIARRILAVFAGVLGLATMLQYTARIDLGIDQLLFPDPYTPVELAPGRMSRATATGFMLYGFAFLFTPRAPRWSFWTGFAMTAIGFWVALFVCLSFLFQVRSLYGTAWFSAVSIHSAVAFLALFAGMMHGFPDRGWARIVLTDKLGGVVARRLLPLMAVLPLGVIWVIQEGAAYGLYTDRVADYLQALALMIVLTAVVIVMCGRLNLLDAHRRVVEQGRQRAVATAVRMRQIAEMDALTELWNRRHFLAVAEEQIAAAHRAAAPLALLMIDIDHFKRINDSHGHAGGDRALRLLGATLKDFTRKDDCAARLGGEEFAVLLPDATRPVAQNIAERICEQMGRLIILDPDGRRFGLTVSIGVASLGEADTKPEELLARADAALYQAKRAGRNRVEVSGAAARSAA